MERIIVEVESNKNIEFLSELLGKFDFISSIKREKIKESKNGDINNMPIEWSKSNADVMALAGIWKKKPRTIEKIREKRFSFYSEHKIL